ncbi:hypothetical protein Sarmat_00560 [Rickettsiales endosymbiont of Paramecium tredecaurelia]|nr:hypothetical protein [Candidatus Sarmatiella mevalonica]
MFMFYNTTLRQMLSKHFRWNKSRVELLGMIILSLFKTQNVQIPKIAESIIRTSHAKHLTNLFSIIFVKAN